MKTKLRYSRTTIFMACILLLLCANVTFGQNLVLNSTCEDHTIDVNDNADAFDMSPPSGIDGGSNNSPYRTLWNNSTLDAWLGSNCSNTSEQPGSTADGNKFGSNAGLGRGVKLNGSCRRIYQKIAVTPGTEYMFSVDSRSEAMGIPTEVFMLNEEITTEAGLENGAADSRVDAYLNITNDSNGTQSSSTNDTFTTNTLTFTASGSFVVIYLRATNAGGTGSQVFYDNFSLEATGSSVTPGTSGQVIGEFPEMDGGMEDQTADSTMDSAGSSQSGTAQTKWTVSSTGNSAVRDMTNDDMLARTGNFSAAWAVNSGSNNVRMQSPSPTSPTIQTNTEYTVQYFYSAPTDPTNDLDAGIYLNNTSGGVAGNTTDVTAFTANTYTKTYITITTGSTFNASNWAVARLDGDDNGYTDTVRIDDFVVYAGTYDDTVPNDPTAPTYANNSGIATIGWSEPLNGVDGGGYVVLKYTTVPNADNDPNQNGIYEFGNTTTNGSGGLTGTVAYIGTATSFTDTYTAGNFYKIYAVDKAFNYSNEVTASDAILGLEDNVVIDFKVYPNPVKDILNISTNNNHITSVSIFNILGEQVYHSKTDLKQIDISSFRSGLYFVNISLARGSVTKKIIKE